MGDEPLKVIELFAGIGSQTQALKNLGIEHEVVAISEIDKHAIKSYEAIHGPVNNLGDITKVETLPECDLLTYSFPCQDLSTEGKKGGMKKGSGTRSGLLWEVERLVTKGPQPKYLLMENVTQVIGVNNKKDFNMWVNALAELGYTSYYGILDSADFGVPQHRERCFMVSTLDKSVFNFPKPRKNETCLGDILEKDVDKSFFLPEEVCKTFIPSPVIRNGHKPPKGNGGNKSIINYSGTLGYYNYNRDRQVACIDGYAPTLCCNNTKPYVNLGGNGEYPVIRCLTPLERWRLMGFSDEAFERARALGTSNRHLSFQAGNSIVVNVLMAIFEQLYLKPQTHKQMLLEI